MSGPLDTARSAWGPGMPEWVEALAGACEADSQSRVAAAMGRSPSLVSQVLRCKYPGDLAAVEEAFNGAFRSATIACPVLGLIAPRTCEEWRRKAGTFENTNPMRVRMFRACHGCARYRKGGRNG